VYPANNLESKSSQQLEMLQHMRKFNLDDQSAILEKVNTSFQIRGTFLSNYASNKTK
jgi:hypothetical protein